MKFIRFHKIHDSLDGSMINADHISYLELAHVGVNRVIKVCVSSGAYTGFYYVEIPKWNKAVREAGAPSLQWID